MSFDNPTKKFLNYSPTKSSVTDDRNWKIWRKKGIRIYPSFGRDIPGYYDLKNHRFVGGLKKWLKNNSRYEVDVTSDVVAVARETDRGKDYDSMFLLIDRK